MRPAGAVFAVLGLIASALPVAVYWNQEFRAAAAVATVVNAILLAWWLLRITPDWIRVPAFAFAGELLAATDKL
jgi:hypothetical protein